jgi:hypothetical protein
VVDASFHLEGDSPQQWKIDTADRLTLYLNPASEADRAVSSSNTLIRAVATGHVAFSSQAYRAEADRAEYEEALKQLSLYGNPVTLIDTRHERRKKAEVVVIRKVGDKIIVDY